MRRLLPLLLGVPLTAAAEIVPGDWEIKVTTVLPGTPQVEQAQRRYLTGEDSRKPRAPVRRTRPGRRPWMCASESRRGASGPVNRAGIWL